MLRALNDLRGLERPARPGRKQFGEERLAAARAGEFTFFARSWELRPPIDWLADPFASRSWRYQLHTLEFLDVLLDAHERHGDHEALEQASQIVCDWIQANHRGTDGISEFAWYDMAVGLRATRLAYVLRAGVHDDVLSDEDESALLSSVYQHGEYLAAEENYKHGHNHGLFEDEGLLQLARLLPTLPEAREWKEIATRRAEMTLRQTISWDEAVHLEHSPAYHLILASLLERLIECGLTDPAFGDLLRRMRSVAGWFVAPDGHLAPLGDTERQRAPAWALEAAEHAKGARTWFESGFATVRAGDSFLVLSSGYHSYAHKQADDLSFVLYERGLAVVGDAGRYGYYEDEPGRRYARSSSGHNTVVIDGDPFDFRRQEPYGSGLIAAGEHGGWYAVEGENPLVRRQGVEHRRLLLYRPPALLLVLDWLESDRERSYVRLIHLGEEVSAGLRDDHVALSAEGLSGTIQDFTGGHTDMEIKRGQEEPELQGWTFPSDREWRAVDCVELRSTASSALLVTAIGVQSDHVTDVRAAARDDQVEVAIEFASGRSADVHCARRGRALVLSDVWT